MIKPRTVYGREPSGKLVVLHCSEDAEAAKAVYRRVQKAGGEGYTEIAFFHPWGLDLRCKFKPQDEVRPAKAMRVKVTA